MRQRHRHREIGDGQVIAEQVGRRHPDVDVVILPPDAPDGPDAPVDSAAPAVDADALNAVAAGLVAAWREVADLLAELGETDGPGLRWAARADGHALVIEKGVRGLGTDGGGDLLRAVAFRLGERDWRLSATSRAGRPQLRATNGLLDFEGVAGAGATMLTLATGVLRAGVDDRATVRADVAEAVTSWQ